MPLLLELLAISTLSWHPQARVGVNCVSKLFVWTAFSLFRVYCLFRDSQLSRATLVLLVERGIYANLDRIDPNVRTPSRQVYKREKPAQDRSRVGFSIKQRGFD